MKKIFNLKNIWRKYIFPTDEINTIEFENHLVSLISFILCFLCSVLNYFYFKFFARTHNMGANLNSFILLLFGIVYLIIFKFKIEETSKKRLLNILTILIIFFIVHRYYPIIGPAVWSFSFVPIIVSVLRKNKSILILLSVELFLSGIYVWYLNTYYEFDEVYYISQFTAFSILFLITSIVSFVNDSKNRKIESQFSDLRNLTFDLETTNAAIEEEIEEHQKTILLLDESEKKFKSIVHALPDVIFKLDYNGKFIDCESLNTAWLLMPKEEFLGRNLEDILPEEISKLALEKIWMTLETNKMQTIEYKLENFGRTCFYEGRFVKANSFEIYAILRDMTESKQKQEIIEYMSYHDHLTGLYNRRFFEEELKRLDTERNLPFTIALVDVNGLKLTNDAFGHLAGDKLLKRVSMILKNQCRSDDIVARIGGDEFVILLPKTSHEETDTIVNRIYKKISKEKSESIIISVSIGWDTKLVVNQLMKDVFIKAEEHMYRKKLTESKSMRNKTIQVILKTLNEKSEREKIHSENVSLISKQIGEAMKLDYETVKEIEIAGLMHDIGKISVNENILNKSGNLTAAEYDEVKRHTESSYQILKSVDRYSSLAEYALCHHERWDGKGYPRGLAGEEIPLVARIIAVADAYEAMIAIRPYKKALSKEEAMEELKKHSGSQFDPKIVNAFMGVRSGT